MRVPALIQLIPCLALAGFTSVRGDEFLFHAGPAVSTPGLGLMLDSGEIPAKELVYKKMFYVDSEALPRPQDPSIDNGEPGVSAERAIQLVTSQDDLVAKAIVTRLELLVQKSPGSVGIDYYLIEYKVNGSTEHRVVLMNEKVLKPKLEKP